MDADGKVVAWQQHFVSFGRNGKFAPSADLSADTYPAGRVPNLSYGASLIPLGVPTGPLRAPGDNALAFVFQSFIDELAHDAGKDPLQFQIDLLGKDELLPGKGRGFQHGSRPRRPGKSARGVRLGQAPAAGAHRPRRRPSTTAISAISPRSSKRRWRPTAQIKINKVWAVGDIGSQVINPTAAVNMTQGAILDGFGEALHQQITIEGGRVVEANFDTFPLLRMAQAPPIEVHFLTSDNSPTGLGEPPLPPAIPALCNAIFAATGKRIRTLPIDTAMLKA